MNTLLPDQEDALKQQSSKGVKFYEQPLLDPRSSLISVQRQSSPKKASHLTNDRDQFSQSEQGSHVPGSFAPDNVRDKTAIMVLNEILKGQERSKLTPAGLKAHVVYKKIRWIRTLVLGLYLVMSFFERPFWCVEMLDRDDLDFEFRKKLEYDCDTARWPSWELPIIPTSITFILELFFLGILIFFTFFRRKYRHSTFTSKVREVIHTLLTITAVVDIITAWATLRPHTIASLVRPFIFILFVQDCLIEWQTSGKRELETSIVCSMAVQGDISADYIVRAVLLVFRISTVCWQESETVGMGEGQAYFSTFSESCFNLLVLLTTANYPDVMMPAYKISRLYAIFFISYLVIGLFFLLNVLLATFYINYSLEIDNVTQHFSDTRAKIMKEKFEILDNEQQGFIQYEQAQKIIDHLEELEDRSHSSNRSDLLVRAMQRDHMRNILNVQRSGFVTQNEFMKILDAYDVLKRSRRSAGLMGIDKQLNSINEQDPPEECCDRCCSYICLKRKPLKKLTESTIYELVMNLLNIANVIALLIKYIQESKSFDSYETWAITEFVLNIVYIFDVCLKIWIYTPVIAIQQIIVRFQLSLQVIFFVGMIVFFIGYTQFGVKTLEVVIILRLLRILVLLQEIHTYSIIIQTLLGLVGPFKNLLGVLMTVYYIFSVIGMELFGGKVNEDLTDDLVNAGVPAIYIYNSFNDFGSGLVTLFELMIVNNWQFVVAMYETALGTTYVRWFFVLFYFLSVAVVLNIVVAFALDMYNSYYELFRSRQEERMKVKAMMEEGTAQEEVMNLLPQNHNPSNSERDYPGRQQRLLSVGESQNIQDPRNSRNTVVE